MRSYAASGDGEHILAIHFAAGAHAQLAKYATVAVQHDSRMRRIHFAAREELREMPVQHTQMIGHRLQCAVTAFFAGSANMFAFDEQHLRDGLAHFIQGWRVVADLLPGYGGRGAGRYAPVSYTHLRAHETRH